MRCVRFSRAAPLVLLAAILAACGESTGPKVPEVTVDSLLADIGQAMEFGAAASTLGGVVAPSVTMPSAATCPYDNSNQRFVCPATTANGLTLTMYFQLFDASNTPQSAFSPTTTAAIRTVTDVSGTVSSPSGAPPSTTTVTGHSDQTLSGLLGATHTLNGTGNMTATMDADLVTLSFTITQTITNLVLPERGSANQYPQSGTIALDIASDADFDAHVTMTFNGTSTVTIVMTSGGTTQTCTLDLKNPQAGPACT
jgi:hypothetical protein